MLVLCFVIQPEDPRKTHSTHTGKCYAKDCLLVDNFNEDERTPGMAQKIWCTQRGKSKLCNEWIHQVCRPTSSEKWTCPAHVETKSVTGKRKRRNKS